MRNTQFWILLVASTLVSVLFIKQIFLSRALDREQRVLVDDRETASTGVAWQNTWQKLALEIYKASRQDPALAAVLKNDNVAIHTAPAPVTGPAAAPPLSPVSSKAPAALSHPSTP